MSRSSGAFDDKVSFRRRGNRKELMLYRCTPDTSSLGVGQLWPEEKRETGTVLAARPKEVSHIAWLRLKGYKGGSA